MKILKIIGWIALLILLIIQFIPTEKNNGEISSLDFFLNETSASSEVKTILKNTCFDCHSNVTQYPWYHSIAPVNFWINHHVEEGKEHLNLSKWSTFSSRKKEHKMEEFWQEIEDEHMPLDSYTWTHSKAKLSDAEIEMVITWAKEVEREYKYQQQR
ncbi:heme-binding domain-containing protein [Tenacibaculum jejuense]|uniref:Haem-binding domain-containing protein n=1 Tax=Tenacibaculum jejuense TaxID=584609 RepID=A0A238UF98_9FLAO|nr:heme-binding domain-containing protein [Tenacibaculum jejuense]SNR17144.1 conserved protein of unknown function [Tenacibaculum jejuense]